MLFIVLVFFSIIFFLEFCYINGSLEEHFLVDVILLIKLFDDDDDDESCSQSPRYPCPAEALLPMGHRTQHSNLFQAFRWWGPVKTLEQGKKKQGGGGREAAIQVFQRVLVLLIYLSLYV